MNKDIYWCDFCEVPVIGNKCGNCGETLTIELRNPLKPVFKKEYEMYVNHLSENEVNFPRIIYRSRNYLLSDVSIPQAYCKLRIFPGDENIGEQKLQLIAVSKKPQRSKYRRETYPLEDKEYLKKLINANLEHLIEIEQEAIDFIKNTIKEFSNHLIMSSFSGGKDSAVTAFLVSKVKENHRVVFSDTGIEYPETINYIKKHGNFFGELIYLEQKNDFYELCNILSPPSRMMRWCCSTQKATPINTFQQKLKKPILSFDGIRKEESTLRADYERIKDNTKMIHQISAYPILNWTEFEVWLYILWREIPFNPLYLEGYSRIGCYPCPNNGSFDNFLMFYFHRELAEKWYGVIQNFASGINWHSSDKDDETLKSSRHIIESKISEESESFEEKDWKHYDAKWVEDNKWKGRRVKYDNDIIGFISAENELNEEIIELNNDLDTIKPCNFDNSIIINLEEKLPLVVKEFLKPFGKVKEKFISNNRIIEVISKNFNIFYSEKSKKIKIKYSPDLNISKYTRLIVRQIEKSLNCFNCGSCIGSCPYGAISINPKFSIDSEKCTHCLTCTRTTYLKFSCVALHYKPNRKLIRRKEEIKNI